MMLFRILVFAAVIAVCASARQAAGAMVTTSTTLSPPTSPLISPVTITLQETHTPPPPPVCFDATSTTNPLGRLRIAMRDQRYTLNAFFDAFLIFYSDEHLSEEPAPEERRLEYISGWEGPGTGVVLADGGAAIWVPSGDVARARSTLTCAWLVLDQDDPAQPTTAEWIAERLGRNGRIGGDARLTSVLEWQALSTLLQREGLQLVHMPALLDQLWNEEEEMQRRRPDFSKIVAKMHDVEYTGVTWRDKVSAVREELKAVGADAMVVTALDEVAWLLNVRGRDVPYAPLLKAFVIVSMKDVRVFAPPGKLAMPVREALAVYNCKSNNCTKICGDVIKVSVAQILGSVALDDLILLHYLKDYEREEVNEYSTIYSELRRAQELKILIPAAGTFQRGASAAIAQSVPQGKRLYQLSPIVYLKAMKNEAEAKGMRKAHLRDAVAMCTLFSYIENKKDMDELSVTKTVDGTRETQAGFVGAAMKTRVAFAANGAEADYRVTNVTNKKIFRNSTLVIQSGGQYIEGTTVVTRTVHYGVKATAEERRAYTTVLRSLGALASLSMPAALPAAHADPVARAPLWALRQDYMHPTGHGIGAALNRKEDPVVIDYRQDTNLHPFREGYFITAEPGWYEFGKFGIRLGNVLEVTIKPNGYLELREATLLPYEPKLIDHTLLTEYEIKWLNAYNDRIRKTVGPELKQQGLLDVYYWMMNKTIPFEIPSKTKKAKTNSGIVITNFIEFTGIMPLVAIAIAMIHY